MVPLFHKTTFFIQVLGFVFCQICKIDPRYSLITTP